MPDAVLGDCRTGKPSAASPWRGSVHVAARALDFRCRPLAGDSLDEGPLRCVCFPPVQ
jgi:hypothetical protein